MGCGNARLWPDSELRFATRAMLRLLPPEEICSEALMCIRPYTGPFTTLSRAGDTERDRTGLLRPHLCRGRVPSVLSPCLHPGFCWPLAWAAAFWSLPLGPAWFLSASLRSPAQGSWGRLTGQTLISPLRLRGWEPRSVEQGARRYLWQPETASLRLNASQ